ncbi:hypothetical protein ENSA5_60280 [Enhygromyxa salina]|uniref:DUF1269 domain-containing protein n=1 Tax=Enhygromyxa salina TaxID=215803 RepID=A0A2S9XDM4_9BACT|nr:hypothetical protein [Enhygromyxa salina]PRP90953.1 hypothetical protein ENSA5_60280 [Enhygromyxa salina]
MTSKRHVYALFNNPDEALKAYNEIQERGCKGEHCSVLVHRDLIDEEELPMAETAAREGAGKGAVLAATTGAVVGGLLLLPGGILGLGPLAAIALGAGTGAMYGSLLGAISGASEPEKPLREFEAELAAGKVLVAVETDDAALSDMCSTVFAAHSGTERS